MHIKTKKLIVICLILALAFTFAACEVTVGSESTKATAATTTGKNGETDAPATTKATSKDNAGATAKTDEFGFTLPEGWQTGNNYYDYIYGVWDTAVLPSWFPAQPADIEVEEMQYKSKTQQTITGTTDVGYVDFDETPFVQIGLAFFCSQATFEEYCVSLEAAGMVGGLESDYPYMTYYYYGNGYTLVTYFNTNDNKDGAYEGNAYTKFAPVEYKNPKTFRGTALPQFGITCIDCLSHYTYFNDNVDAVDYDLSKDDGVLDGEYWAAWFRYAGCTDDDLRSYAAGLESSGWKKLYDGVDEGGYGYYVFLEKDGVYAYGRMLIAGELELGFSPLQENLTY